MSDLAATVPLYSARPTVSIDGQDDARLSAGTLAMSVHEDVFGLYRCELTIGNWGTLGSTLDFLFFDRELIDFGKQIAIRLGDGDAGGEVFNGYISGIEGRFIESRPPEMLILAEDKLQDLRMVRRSRSFEDTTLDDVVNTIANDHGLTADVDIDSPQYRILTQLNQSDLAFLQERARLVDAEVSISDGQLAVQSRRRRRVSELTLRYKQRLHEFSVNADLAHQRTHLAVGGWDVAGKTATEVEVDQSIMQSELGGGRSGGSILEEAYGRRRDTISHLSPMNEEETRSLAEAHYRCVSRRFVTGQGIAEGDVRLRAGAYVTLEGIGPWFNGEYYVTEAMHAFTPNHGFCTHFSVERPGLETA